MQKLFIKVNVIFMALFLIIACDDTNPPNAHSDDPQIVGNESIAQELAQDYNGNDITFTFNNGVTLSILSNDNKGASNGKVTLKHIQNEIYFNSVNDIVIDFADVKSNYTFTLEHTLKPNLVKGDITVFKYTPDRAKDKLNAQIVNFDYDAASGKINAKITGLGTISSGKMPVLQNGNNSRLIISWADRYKLSDGDEQVVMQVPYYEQPGGSCWATCAQMLTKAYPRDDDEYSNRLGVIDFIKYLKHTSLDEGIGLWDFKMNLPNAINLYSSTKTEVSTFVSSSNMLEEIINKLRENKPLIMNLTYPGVGRHAIMIIGYKRELISIAKINVKLLIHNPQNVGTESMYKWVDWEWLMKEKWPQEAYQILYPNKPLKTTELELLTMGLPINKYLGDLAFVVGTDSKNYSIGLQYDNSEANGYKWVFPNGVKCEKLPDTVSYLSFKLPVYNAYDKAKEVTYIVAIKDKKTGTWAGGKIFSDTKKCNPGETIIEGKIENINDILKTEIFEGNIEIELAENGVGFVEKYSLDFKMDFSKEIELSIVDISGITVNWAMVDKNLEYDEENNKTVPVFKDSSLTEDNVNILWLQDIKLKGNGLNYSFKDQYTTIDMTFSKNDENLITSFIYSYFKKETDKYGTLRENKTYVKLRNISLNKTTKTVNIKGTQVCSHIESNMEKYWINHLMEEKGNPIQGICRSRLTNFNCTDKSVISIYLK